MGKEIAKSEEPLSNYISNFQNSIVNIPVFVSDDKVFLQTFRETNPQYQFLPTTTILISIDSVIFLFRYFLSYFTKSLGLCPYWNSFYLIYRKISNKK